MSTKRDVLRVLERQMSRAIREITDEQGYRYAKTEDFKFITPFIKALNKEINATYSKLLKKHKLFPSKNPVRGRYGFEFNEVNEAQNISRKKNGVSLMGELTLKQEERKKSDFEAMTEIRREFERLEEAVLLRGLEEGVLEMVKEFEATIAKIRGAI